MTTQGQAAMAEDVNLVISQGAENTYAWKWKHRATEADPYVGVDLTTWTARAQIRAAVGQDVWAEFTTAVGGGLTLDAEGNITLTIGHAITEAIEWQTPARKNGFWDLELIDATGEVTRFAMGSVTVSQDVTRDG